MLVKMQIFSRMLPDEKNEVVECLQMLGHAVLMCGDGANDCIIPLVTSISLELKQFPLGPSFHNLHNSPRPISENGAQNGSTGPSHPEPFTLSLCVLYPLPLACFCVVEIFFFRQWLQLLVQELSRMDLHL
jgi:hypothetical protein